MNRRHSSTLCAILLALPAAAAADDLYQDPAWAAIASDRKATRAGDILTVVIFQSAEAVNSAQNSSRKASEIGGSLNAGSINESGNLSFGGNYSGRGEVRRSEKFVTQMSLAVTNVLPNGDLAIEGVQWLRINGEKTRIAVRGRVRPADIRGDNSVLSTRIADAQIDYDGRGFVSRSAKPGLINRVFGFLGLI